MNDRIIEILRDAQKLIEMNMAGAALMTCRNALELMVKNLCLRCGMQCDSREADLSEMIDALFRAEIVNENIKDLLHRARITCNKAAHIESEVTLGEAQETFNIIKECYGIMVNFADEAIRLANKTNNVPMSNPDYYSRNRRYYGKWAYCMDRHSLLVIPEYVELENRANEGDVEAMLNLAVGFLQQNILWSSDKLVNMPSYIHRGVEYNQDKVYDRRYYYWILNAVNGACLDMDKFPRKYIATAIWEAYSVWFNMLISPSLNNYVSEVREIYDKSSGRYNYFPVYEEPDNLIQRMFNLSTDYATERICFGLQTSVISVAREVFGGINYCDYVAPIYDEAKHNPFLKLRFLSYCAQAYANDCWYDNQNDKFTLSATDAEDINNDLRMLSSISGKQNMSTTVSEGDIFSWQMLLPYTVGAFCNEKYNLAKYNAEQVRKSQTGMGKVKSGIKTILGEYGIQF